MRSFIQSRWFAVAAIAVALALLAGGILFTRAELRAELRSQLASREGRLFASLLRQQLNATGDDALVDPLAALLETARLPDIPGFRTLGLFDTNGTFIAALPAHAAEVTLAPAARTQAAAGRTFSAFHPAADLAAEFILPPAEAMGGTRMPLLEVVVPITDPLGGQAIGFARLLLDGDVLTAEYRALDVSLTRQARLAFALTGGAMALALGFAFHRLNAANRRLSTANRELTLAAKTAAIGAVTSHLLHGLKNPLAGLQQFVTTQGSPDGAEWSDAAETTRRMRGMIDGVLRVLRDETLADALEFKLSDALDALHRRLAPAARERHVVLEVCCGADRELPARDANLIVLVIENLAANAIQASTAGGRVTVLSEMDGDGLCLRVKDQAEGLPEHVQANLFAPVRSTKEGGTGIGLALSRQIARTLGATLDLVHTGRGGTEFLLRVPRPTAEIQPGVADITSRA